MGLTLDNELPFRAFILGFAYLATTCLCLSLQNDAIFAIHQEC